MRESVMKASLRVDDVDQLEAYHRSLNGELSQLMRRGYLTPSEYERSKVLKKMKLRAKDRLYRIK